jgi:ABC-type transport system involved in cytochrome bd biosynthesis fused ATPase/permease subunit
MSNPAASIWYRRIRRPALRLPDHRLLPHTGGLRGALGAGLMLGLAVMCLIALQAALLARLVAGALWIPGTALGGLLAGLVVVLTLRVAAASTLRSLARRRAAAVRSQLRRQLGARVTGLGPFWLGRQPDGEITTLSSDGLDAVEDYLARYLPRMMLAWLVPPLIAVGALVALVGHLGGGQAALLAAILGIEAGLALRAVSKLAEVGRQGWVLARQACVILDSEPSAVRPASSGAATLAPRRVPAGAEARRGPAPISLHGVTLCYPGMVRPALSDISLTARPGEHLAITGPTAAGKSSLLALLLRFAQPTAGLIEYDGHDFGRIPDAQWLDCVAWLPQRPHVVAGTVAENIALARAGSTQDSVQRAARLAGADEFIEALPGGYQARLGGCGVHLSPTQLVFIELARAVLRDAPLLLLDDPTAQLPPDAAGLLLDRVATCFAGRTVIHVTRDQSLARHYGRSLELSEGRLRQPIPALQACDRLGARRRKETTT